MQHTGAHTTPCSKTFCSGDVVPSRLWHVTVTVAGDPQDPSLTHDGLRRLQRERPFIHSLRYDEDRAEVSYWEEGEEMIDAASLALRMWNEHRTSADLPSWRVVGLEVIDRDTYQARHLAVPLAASRGGPAAFQTGRPAAASCLQQTHGGPRLARIGRLEPRPGFRSAACCDRQTQYWTPGGGGWRGGAGGEAPAKLGQHRVDGGGGQRMLDDHRRGAEDGSVAGGS